jgi:hypothetical protein
MNETLIWSSKGILSLLDFEVLDARRNRQNTHRIFLLYSCQSPTVHLGIGTIYSMHHLISNLQLSLLGIHIIIFSE